MWWPCFKFTSGFWEQVLLLCTPSVLLLLTLNTSIQHKPTHWRKMNHLLCSCFKCLAKSMHACIVVYTVLSLVVQWHTITCLLIIWTQMQVVTCFIFIFLQYVTYTVPDKWYHRTFLSENYYIMFDNTWYIVPLSLIVIKAPNPFCRVIKTCLNLTWK